MKSLKGVWIVAIVISVATVVFVEFVRDSASEKASIDPRATTARGASIATPSNQQDKPYKQNRALAMSTVRNAYFAVGCKIFTSDEEVLPLVAQKLSALNEEAKAHGITDVKLQEELNAAGHDGVTQAQRSGACDYWEQHPEAVFALRRAVREAAEP
jgi:hypothetical protein